jgi:hypothetical protein
MSRYVSKEKRQIVKERANTCCEYCQCQEEFCPSPFSIEHVTPLAKNGTDDLENLAYSCQGCNNFKYISIEAIDPLSGEMVKLYHPRKDVWNEHFRWSKDHLRLIGISPSARATIDLLKLNRKGVLNFRRATKTLGKHPPSHLNLK